MPKKLPPLEIESMPGKQYSDIDSAFCAALPTLANDLAVTIRRLVADGYFIVKDGKLIRNPERMRKANEL
jgi:hypothetical protein